MKNMKNNKKRNFNLDVIRTLALFNLISVHFLLNNNFYQTDVNGIKMYIAFFFRSCFMTCVPLFLLLTGFLMSKKKTVDKNYYKGLKKILINYVLAILFVYIVRGIYKNESLSILEFLKLTLSYKNSAWYVNMYIGLFLLIPFLNVINLNIDKKQKKYLILTFLILSTLPSILNIYNFNSNNWFFCSKLKDGYDILVPNWWTSIYPLTYFFIGAYLADYKINISKLKNILLILLVLICSSSFNYIRSYGGKFEWAIYNEWGSIQNILSSTLTFILIINFNFDKINQNLKNIIIKISNLSFVAYLVHQVFELIVYDLISLKTQTFYEKSVYYIPAVLSIAFLSLMSSVMIEAIYNGILKIISKIEEKYKTNS